MSRRSYLRLGCFPIREVGSVEKGVAPVDVKVVVGGQMPAQRVRKPRQETATRKCYTKMPPSKKDGKRCVLYAAQRTGEEFSNRSMIN